MIVETLKEYDHIFSRLRKLHRNIVSVANANNILKEANKKLREDNRSLIEQSAARERVLQSFVAKYEPTSQTPT